MFGAHSLGLVAVIYVSQMDTQFLGEISDGADIGSVVFLCFNAPVMSLRRM